MWLDVLMSVLFIVFTKLKRIENECFSFDK